MKLETKNKLFEAWDYCDMEDKSTEFMFQYMSDMAGVDYDRVVDFVCNCSNKERDNWYKKQPTNK